MNKDNSNNNVCCKVCGTTNENTDLKFIKDDEVNLILCEECIDVMHSALNLSKKDKKTVAPLVKPPVRTPNPKEVYSFLNKHVISQDEAKKQLAIGIAQHYRRIKDPSIDKSNILIMGPTGTGKTEMARSVSKFLDVPFVSTDATSLTTRGYSGEDTVSVVAQLLQSCNYDVERAQKGIIFIDEIDKIAKMQNNDSQISTVSIQQELLKIMEGSLVKVYKGGKGRGEEVYVDTKNILFICAGSFAGIEEIISPKSTQSIGLVSSTKEDTSYNVPQKLDTEHLLKFGFIPEFLGRIPVIVHTLPLTESDLFKILTEPENSVINQYKKLLLLDGIIATFEEEFLKELVVEAQSKKIGARGIKKVLDLHLKELFFNIEEYAGCEIIVGSHITKISDSNVFSIAR